MARSLAAVLAFGVWLAATSPAPAADLEFFTGESLSAQCSAKPGDADFAVRQARCVGYIVGVSDAEQAVQGQGPWAASATLRP